MINEKEEQELKEALEGLKYAINIIVEIGNNIYKLIQQINKGDKKNENNVKPKIDGE